MLNCKLLAGAGLALAFACSGVAAQDTQPGAPAAPQPKHLRLGPGMVLGGPRVREPGPRLGVSVESTPDGLKVNGVDDGSLAASAGLKADDVLLRIGDRHIKTVDDVALALHGLATGAEVEVTVIRPGQGLVTLKGTLPAAKEPAEKPDEPMQGADGVKGGFLGVQMKTDAKDGGVTVAGVVPDSAAWFAGLQEGDVLLSLDGKALATPEDLAGAVAGKDPGSFVELKFRRGSDEQTAKVRLGRRSPIGFLGGLGLPGAMNGQHPLRLRIGPGAQGGQPDQDDGFDMPDMQMPDFQPFLNGNFPGMDDLHGALQDLHGALRDGGSHSVSVQIEKDHMTITKDGVTTEYERDANGQWTKQEDKTPADATPHGA